MARDLTNEPGALSIPGETKAIAHGNLSEVVDADVQGEMINIDASGDEGQCDSGG